MEVMFAVNDILFHDFKVFLLNKADILNKGCFSDVVMRSRCF